jgi:hypothetical protein
MGMTMNRGCLEVIRMKKRKLKVAFVDDKGQVYSLDMATPEEINNAIIELSKEIDEKRK